MIAIPESLLVAGLVGVGSIIAWAIVMLFKVTVAIGQVTTTVKSIQRTQIEQDRLINELRIQMAAVTTRLGFVEPTNPPRTEPGR